MNWQRIAQTDYKWYIRGMFEYCPQFPKNISLNFTLSNITSH